MVATGVEDRLRGIRERWVASEEQRADAQAAIGQRDLTLANSPADLQEREDRLRRRHLRLEGIVDQDDSVWLSFFDCGLRAARSVGRVVEAPRRQPVVPIGTGSLVTDRLLLTNHHVVRTPDEAAGMAVEFAYEYDEDGESRNEDRWPLAPGDCFVTDPDLDYTVVAVALRDGRPPGETYGSIPLIGQTGKAVIGEVLNVIHHPAGQRKRVSLRFNRMVAEDDLWLRYESDTREGSSGAPVFNDQWEMVALHHGGVAATDDEGFELTRDGQRWTRDMGEDAVAYVGNEGARVSRIVRSLRGAGVPLEQRRLLTPILGEEQ
ncbi:V8-like Glu-specific endopeptidase [Geodermatophilus obscurus]|uniref:V8-like Glu-specific endopeptidase n=2 Tax=Geodermatophilus obscurus TaxID=1861 RepID=A0A1M7UKK4_9ACTN|nr:V8-like Glu-specific endopeptidase [Geodermatophilus obscurus]